MRIVPSTEEHIQWILGKVNCHRVEGGKGISAVSDTGKLLCCCLMDSWTEGSVQVHIAIDSPIGLRNYTFIREVFNYIFVTHGRRTALGFVSSDNKKAMVFDKRLGFKELARIKDGARHGIDTVILELRREECKWINMKEAA